MSLVLAVALLGVAAVQASPAISARQSITALTTVQIDAFTPYTYYASAGYCTPTQTLAWDCGSTSIQGTTYARSLQDKLTPVQIKRTAKPTLTLSLSPLVATVTPFSIVRC